MPERRLQAFFGGPDLPVGALRDLLAANVDAVPAGGEIFWVTYYFLDQALAEALLRAHHRGVRVRVLLEGRPRTAAANRTVRALLGGADGLGAGLRVVQHRLPDNLLGQRGRLHEKLYYFSHPRPRVFVGTFNPSGGGEDAGEILAEIGDQDRGHNFLVQVNDPGLVAGLRTHAHHLFERRHGPWERLLTESNRVLDAGDTRIFFFPRRRRNVLGDILAGLEAGARVRIAASHFNDGGCCRLFGHLAGRGVGVEIIAHDTLRRVPRWVEKGLRDRQVAFHRYCHPQGWPMHLKVMLIESGARRQVLCGSLNLSRRSLRLNHEVLLQSEDRGLFGQFEARWETLLQERRHLV